MAALLLILLFAPLWIPMLNAIAFGAEQLWRDATGNGLYGSCLANAGIDDDGNTDTDDVRRLHYLFTEVNSYRAKLWRS
jgi:hypothetical protein